MVLNCAVNMLMGGALALYIGELYKRLGTSISNRDNFSGVFPMLTMVTVVIIFVVKSSLALSLGLLLPSRLYPMAARGQVTPSK